MSSIITHRSLLRALVGGFSLVLVLLLSAGFVAVHNVQSIRRSAAQLVSQQGVTSRLIQEIQREQRTLNAVFYKLARSPEVDRDQVLQQLDEADEAIDRIVASAAGTPDALAWSQLHAASSAFSSEARRLLAAEELPEVASRDLFRRHEQVISIVGRLITTGYQRAIDAQKQIEEHSRELVNESVFLLGGCLLLALLTAAQTVRITSALFRKMEWQTGELSRVSWRLLEGQESTARRFSHELHDELGQSLTAVKANLLALQGEGGGGPRLEDCLRLVEEAVSNVRELSQLLRPTILDDFGLDASLRWLAEKFTQRTGIETRYESNFSGRIADETETHLFRIGQEALTNIARHSGATRAEIDLRAEGGRIRLSISDNGKGLPSDRQLSGMGMIGMRARARSAGGELTVHSQPNKGVRIAVWAPAAANLAHELQDSHPVGR